MSAVTAILTLDARGIMRDSVMLANIGLSVVGMLAITAVGYFQSSNEVWSAWFPFLIILSLMSGPGAYGFLFGLLMVDEKDTGVRGALSVMPVRPFTMLATRTLIAVLLMLVWPMITVVVMNATWQSLPIPYSQIFLVVCVLALIAPVTALAVASYSTNKVEALALFKGLNFLILAPLILKFIPEGAAYQYLFLVSPSAWGYYAFDSFVQGSVTAAYFWLTGGVVFNLFLLGMAMSYYMSATYKTGS